MDRQAEENIFIKNYEEKNGKSTWEHLCVLRFAFAEGLRRGYEAGYHEGDNDRRETIIRALGVRSPNRTP